jgi:hypothetical protein
MQHHTPAASSTPTRPLHSTSTHATSPSVIACPGEYSASDAESVDSDIEPPALADDDLPQMVSDAEASGALLLLLF